MFSEKKELFIRESILEKNTMPFFLYDMETLKDRLDEITNSNEDVTLYYAVKANPLSSILKLISETSIGFDCASLGELNQVLKIGVDPDRIVVTGPCKSKSYLKQILELGVRFVEVESQNQLLWLNEVAAELDLEKKVKVILRFQLEWNSDQESVLGGNSITAFGLGVKDWDKILSDLNSNSISNLDIQGIHVFQWGNVTDTDNLINCWKEITKTSKEFCEKFGLTLKMIDFGGGLGVDYSSFKNNNMIDWNKLKNFIKEFKNENEIESVVLELGRYIVSECGYYFNPIVDKKTVRNKNLLICSGGVNHLVRPALIKESFPGVCFHKNENSTELKVRYNVHGPLCTALDFLGEYEFQQTPEIDDWIVLGKVGAYGFTESMPYFLCHELASEVILESKDNQLTYTKVRGNDLPETWLK